MRENVHASARNQYRATRKCLIVTDLDNTLLGDSAATSAFVRWWSQHVDQLQLVYASGRSFRSIVASINETGIPAPAAIIGGVGTEIRYYPSGELLDAWQDQPDEGWSPTTVRRALQKIGGLVPQPHEFLSRYKLSYYLEGADPAMLEVVKHALSDNSVPADVIYSSQRDLDIVPAGMNKGSAAAFLAWLWGYGKSEVIVCGDSGNDLSMFARGFRGVVVANAQQELRGVTHPDVYHADQSFAAGVIEGVEHWLLRG